MEPPWGRAWGMCRAPARALAVAEGEGPAVRNATADAVAVVDVVPDQPPAVLALGAPVAAEVHALVLRCVGGALEVVADSVADGALADAWSWLSAVLGPPLGPALDPPLHEDSDGQRTWWLVGLQFLAWAALLVALGVLRWDSRLRFRQEELFHEWGSAAPALASAPRTDPPPAEPPLWPPLWPPRFKRRKVKSAAPGLASWRVRCEL